MLMVILFLLKMSFLSTYASEASCSCGVISTRKQFYCEGNVAELYELITDNQRNAMPSDKLLLQDTSTVKSFSGEKLKGLSVSCTNTIGILLDPKFENKPCSYSYCREHMEDWFSKDNHYDVVQCPEDLEVQRGIDYIICVNSPILKILVECMNFCDNTQTQVTDAQRFTLAVSFAAIFGTVIILGVAIAIGLWFYKSRTNKRRPQENLAQQDRPSPQGNAVVYEELPYDTHVTDYSIPVDCIAPPPPVGSRPVREKQQNGRDCYQCAINNQSTTVKSGEIVYSKYPPTALQPPIVSNAYSTEPVLDSANSSSTPQPVKSHTEDQDGDVSKEEERKEALYFTLEKGGSEISSDEEDYFHRKTSNFGLLPVENEDEGDQPDIN